ncbi:MAG: phage major capsid protein [Tepidisphaeraceae bacterium]
MNWQQIKALNEQRGQTLADMKSILKTAEDEKRELNEAENTQFDGLNKRAEDIKSTIDRYEAAKKLDAELAERRQQQPGRDDINTPEQRTDDAAKEYRSQFGQYLRGSNAIELRGLTTGSVGVVGDRVFGTSIVESLKQYAGVLNAGAEIIPTADGNERGIPTIDDTGNTGRQTGEATANTNETNPTVGNVTLKAYMQDSDWIRISMEYLRDASYPIEQKLIELATKRIGRKLNALTTTGNGTGTIRGFVAAGGVGKTAAATNAITYEEFVDFQHSLDASYRYGKNCRIQLHDLTLAALRKLKGADNRYIWQPGQTGLPATLDGFGYIVNNDMAHVGSGAGSVIAAIGDWEAYKVRVVGQPEVIITKEKYIDSREVGYRVVQAFDGNLADAQAVKLLKLAAS